MAFTDTDDAVVAAGLAVQSQYPWTIFTGGGKGLAQASSEELDGRNPYSSSVAVDVMESRISTVVEACRLCQTPTDRLIVAALAQNSPGFNKNTVTYLPRKENGQIDWVTVMTDPEFSNPSAIDARARQWITGTNYETRLMLKIYMQDLRVLIRLGYQLPDEYKGADFEYLNFLINNPQRASQYTPQ